MRLGRLVFKPSDYPIIGDAFDNTSQVLKTCEV